MAVGLDPGATTTAGSTSAVDPLSEQFWPRCWLLTCSCGWTSEFSQRWQRGERGEAASEARQVRHKAPVTIEESPANAPPGTQLLLI